ncbi:MAG: hypothetical protein K6U80_15165 [Firmicutes bacterium]|nr:hypothetical protein [Bacillota bacterium]
MGSPEIDPTIKELLQKKVCLFEMLLDCAKQQSGLSYPDNPAQYDNIIETRAGIIEDLKKLDIILDRNLEVKAIDKGGLDAQMETINKQIANIVGQIIIEDRKSHASITQEFQNVKEKLQVIRRGKKGTAAYSAYTGLSPGGVYTDSKR